MKLAPIHTRFSKPLTDITSIKKSFSSKNSELLDRALKINEFYISQPFRAKCKACDTDMPSTPDFFNHQAPYHICRNCSHLNGLHEDTSIFSDFLYKDDSGSNYSANYLSDYELRVKNIYRPKLDFLLHYARLLTDKLSLSDFGCGGGHFINSITETDPICNAAGYDISIDLISLAQRYACSHQRNASFLSVKDEAELLDHFINSQSSVFSLLGVLEHLHRPRDFLKAFAEHETASILFIQIPLFGLSVLTEHSFDNIFPRLLSSGHTHLFTRSSIAYLLNEFNLVPFAEWHFGTDAMDLRRSLLVNATGSSPFTNNYFSNIIFPPELMNELQEVIDKYHLGCQTHLVITKKT